MQHRLVSSINSPFRFRWASLTLAVLYSAYFLCAIRLHAAPPRVLPAGELPADSRLGPLKGERGDFSFVPPRSPDQWKHRAEEVRRIMLVSLGLWPLPTKTPLEAVIHGKLDQGDYTVEKVYFQSMPGFYVTGSLYRPKGPLAKRPAVLSAHGHFPGGRFQDAGRDAVRRMIVQGAERFEQGGRSFMQSRCVQLARMGCVVFHYDMIGYADNQQLPLEVAHRFSNLRAKFNKPPATGFYSAMAELELQNPLGLHTCNSIRALDFLTSLPDVDPKRIAVTGGSGGGTQTFMLCALDDRPLVSVPVVIVSTTRQGGCTCENISNLRIGTYNLEFTALHAPKPLLLISADDATRTMPERGFPELRQLYKVLGAEADVAHAALLHFPHNYNYVSRARMYHWLNKHLQLGLKKPILERPFKLLSREQLTVWDQGHPRPKIAAGFEQALLAWWAEDSAKQIEALRPHDPASLKRYREVVGSGWKVLLRGLPQEAGVRFDRTAATERGRYRQTLGLVRYQTIEGHRAELPAVLLSGKKKSTRTVVWIDGQGKSGLFDRQGMPKPAVRELLDAGATVVGADLLYQGEFQKPGQPITRQRGLPSEDGYAGWTYCYNLPVFARRVHDILAVIAFARQTTKLQKIELVGLSGGGPLAAAAASQARDSVSRLAIDTGGFRFAGLKDLFALDFLPGGARYDDLPGLIALSAPTPLWLSGETTVPPVVQAAYQAADGNERLTIDDGSTGDSAHAAVRWLLNGQD